MNFLVMGGGCYGSYFCRQLLRGASRLGLQKITVVDHDPQCQVRTEMPDARIIHVTSDWHDFLFPYFHEQVVRARNGGGPLTDHYVPPCLGPHFLFEVFEQEVKHEHTGIQLRHLPVDQAIGTPVDMKLADGHRAVSFAEWVCPHSCIEPPKCPVTRGDKFWDMKKYLTKFMAECRGGPMWPPGQTHRSAPTLHLLECKHLAMGVGTIPMQLIVDEYLRFSKAVSRPGRHLAALATISSCHGLVGLLEISV